MAGNLAKALAPVLGRDDDVDKISAELLELLQKPLLLIKKTTRVEVFTDEQLLKVFNIGHHVESAKKFFEHLSPKGGLLGSVVRRREPKCAVVFGHKQQGKSQFLYFLAVLLQKLGEGVVYLDKSIAGGVMKLHKAECCFHVWKTNLETFLEKVSDQVAGTSDVAKYANAALASLTTFAKNGTHDKFAKFHEDLDMCISEVRQLSHSPPVRLWMIIDEASSDEMRPFLIDLPEEQAESTFRYILTGSVGISHLVAERHLQNFVWDLPLFTRSESASLTWKLHEVLFPDAQRGGAAEASSSSSSLSSLSSSSSSSTSSASSAASSEAFWDQLCVKGKTEGASDVFDINLGDKLEKLFGGVPGYITELMLELGNGGTLTSYTAKLSTRVYDLILKEAKQRHISDKDLAHGWLVAMREGEWSGLRNAGLCGSSAPRGAIFTAVLNWLWKFAEVDELSIVRTFRQRFRTDPGMDGNLLELEEIINLKRGTPLITTLLKLDGTDWVAHSTIRLLDQLPCQHWVYNEQEQSLNLGKIYPADGIPPSKWHCVEVPAGFCVVDVLLVHATKDELSCYLVQITRSKDPFVSHDTDETCSKRSKQRISELIQAAKDAIVPTTSSAASEVTLSVFYVMLAPNTEDGKFVAPDQTRDYYFSPQCVVPTQSTPSRKRSRSVIKCCNCTSGNCSTCACSRITGSKCETSCVSPKCMNK